jgi:hypothetical protein
MSAHWRLALRYSTLVSVGAVVIGAVVWSLYDGAYAAAFLYGVVVGIVSFISTALTVSMLTRRSSAWVVAGVASFVARYGFVAGSLAAPAYMNLWPVVAMLGGFVTVYLAENVVLFPGVLGIMSGLSAKGGAGRAVRERVERRVGA